MIEERFATELLPFMGMLALKATVILVVAACAAFALRRGAASRRHLVWSCTMAAILLLPALTAVLPAVPVGIWRSASPAPVFTAPEVRVPEPAFLAPADDATRPGTERSGWTTAPAAAPAVPGGRVPLRVWAILAWGLGAAVVVARLALGQVGIHRLRSVAEPVDASYRWLATEMSARLRLHRTVELLRSPDATMPMTWGVLQPTILLPEEASDWPEDRRRAVLLHELAHVKRMDCLTQTIALLCCGLFWFHPGVWWAARRMRVERETACDDAVIAAGMRPTEYATQLLEVARAYRSSGSARLAAVAMARPSHLEGRLLAVLDAARDRAQLTRRVGAAGLAAALVALLPLSALRPTAQAATTSQLAATELDTIPRAATRATIAERAVAAGRAEIAAALDPELQAEVEDHVMSEALANGQALVEAVVEAGVRPKIAARLSTRSSSPSRTDTVAVPALIQALRDSDAEVRRSAAWALGEIGDRRAVVALIAALRDPATEVRRFAAHALGEIDDPRAVEPLTVALRDSDPEVTRYAAWALSEIGDPRAAPALAAALSTTGDEDARRMIIVALGELDLDTAPQPLLDAVGHADAATRKAAIHALAEIGDQRALPALRGALRDDNAEVRKSAIFAIFEFDDPASVDLLIELLKDPDPQVRRQAAMRLGDRG